jgi:hypothetical protein
MSVFSTSNTQLPSPSLLLLLLLQPPTATTCSSSIIIIIVSFRVLVVVEVKIALSIILHDFSQVALYYSGKSLAEHNVLFELSP